MLSEHFENLLDQVQAHKLADIFEEHTFEAKEKFTEQGSGRFSNKLGFIEKGLARSYYLDSEGDENTVCFSYNNMMLLDPVRFYSDRNSNLTIEFIEKSVVHITDREKLESLFDSDPLINTLGRKLAQDSYLFMTERVLDRNTLSAEERYLNLMKNKELFQKIPLKYLASYIGITNTSLSRIRKNLSDKA